MPDFSIEDEISGPVCGLDEAGRGPIAGPVVAACVYIPPEIRNSDVWRDVNDSKKIAPARRAALNETIKAHARWGVGIASAREIEDINILQASFLAMRRAFEGMNINKKFTALIDGNRLPRDFPCPARAVVRGDSISVSIAAASIIAKCARDEIMTALAREHPVYGWDKNAGYPTPEHIAAITAHGITDHHRKTYAPVASVLTGSTKSR